MERRTRTQLALGLFLILVAAFLAALRLYPPLPRSSRPLIGRCGSLSPEASS